MKRDQHIDELTLNAYLDGELDGVRAAEVEAWLDAHPEARTRLGSWRANDDALREALAPTMTDLIPRRLYEATVEQRSPRARRQRLTLAASITALAVGTALGWAARDYRLGSEQDRAATLAARAIDAHIVYAADVRHPVEVAASEHEHLNAWLSRRLQRAVAAPDLSGVGYRLLGGRLLSQNDTPLALFMYEDATGRRLTVVVAASADSQDGPPRHVLRDDLQAMSWSQDQLSLAVSGPVDSDRLRAIKEAIRVGAKG